MIHKIELSMITIIVIQVGITDLSATIKPLLVHMLSYQK